MDRVTKALTDSFGEEQALSGLSESDLFEYFGDYCVVTGLYEEEFDLSDIHVGGAQDVGLDGLAIIVNGVLVTSTEEAEDLLNLNGFLDVKFAFIQSKTTSGFSGEQIATFFEGVEEFFADSPTLPMSEQILAAREIMTWLYTKSVKFTRAKPVVEMFYVTTGQWKEDAHLLAKINKDKRPLEESGLFSSVHFEPWGADEVQAAYQRSKNNVTVEFTFGSKILMPTIDGVEEAYLGVLPSDEYLSIITDPSGNIRKPLFYDNVRDFQGSNPVNGAIAETLDDAAGRQRFAVLNNGVTIVTRDLRTVANKFIVSDYQIVNGCQTSHVLFASKEQLGDSTFIPVKVIHTSNEEIISAIITATNSQTQVTADDLYALSGFQKRLESLYDSFPDKKKLFYERRSKQYAAINGVEKVRIIGKSQQLRAFASMFLDDPHRAARYISDLRGQVPAKIFNDDHKLEPYYASAYGYYKLEYLFRNYALPVYYKPARYQLLMALRYIVGGKNMPALTANKAVGYANKIAELLWSDDAATEAFKKGIEVVDTALNGASLTRDVVKTQGFTDAVKAALLTSLALSHDGSSGPA